MKNNKTQCVERSYDQMLNQLSVGTIQYFIQLILQVFACVVFGILVCPGLSFIFNTFFSVSPGIFDAIGIVALFELTGNTIGKVRRG